jgi:carboxymethylenebutenolidase
VIDWIRLATGADAALAVPPAAARGAVVVAGELFGLTDYVTGVVERLAAAGYVAVAPDFYWRTERRAVLAYDEEGRRRGFALLATLRADDVVADIAAARDVARHRAGEPTGTAVLGFSAGGHMAVLAGTRLPFDLIGSCYGAWTLDGGIPLAEPDPPLRHAEAIAAFGAELLGVVGDRDHVISAQEWDRIDRRLTKAGVAHELVTYPGRPHGFLCPDRPDTYDAAATDDVWRRLFDALDRRVARGQRPPVADEAPAGDRSG